MLAARRLERLEALAGRIAWEGGSALAVRCDVTELDQLTELRDRVATTFERCDVLINNAGIRGGGPFETTGIEYLNRVIDVNLRGVVLGTKVFLPMMLERRPGSHRQRRFARRSVRHARGRDLRRDQTRGRRVERGPVPRARPEGDPGHEREPRLLAHRGLPGDGSIHRPAGPR